MQAVWYFHFSCVQDRTRETSPEAQVSEKTVDQPGEGALKYVADLVYEVLHLTVLTPAPRDFHFSFDNSLRVSEDALRIHADNSRFLCAHCYVPYVAVH